MYDSLERGKRADPLPLRALMCVISKSIKEKHTNDLLIIEAELGVCKHLFLTTDDGRHTLAGLGEIPCKVLTKVPEDIVTIMSTRETMQRPRGTAKYQKYQI